MAEIKAGDVVRLKSGGPKMTVAGRPAHAPGQPEGTAWHCQWFDGEGALLAQDFEPAALEVVKGGKGGA